VNLLIIGGTRFQGPWLVKYALEGGLSVTVFHKGQHPIAPQNGLHEIVGDRDSSDGLAPLRGHHFDLCIDTCAYFPHQVSRVRRLLNVDHYSLVSTILVYKSNHGDLLEESALVAPRCLLGTRVTPENYAALKVLCEQESVDMFGKHCLIFRPSYIIGPDDHTERLHFWGRLVCLHGKLVRFPDYNPIRQFVDVRDLARFIVACALQRKQGVVNVCGSPINFFSFLKSIASCCGTPPRISHLQWSDLCKLGFSSLPYLEDGHQALYNTDRAREWGFNGRSLANTIRDVLKISPDIGLVNLDLRKMEGRILNLLT